MLKPWIFTTSSLLILAAAAPAQVIDVAGLDRPAPLAGVWRTTNSDDPRFADPAFDDSAWRELPLPGPGPGRSTTILWLRARVRISGPLPADLALLLPPIAPRYEVFLDGRRIHAFGGDGLGQTPAAAVIQLDAAREWTLAVRCQTYWVPTYHLDFQEPARLGPRQTLEQYAARFELARRWNTLSQIVWMTATVAAGLFFLVIPLWRRDALEYLWIGLVLVCGVAIRVNQVVPWAWNWLGGWQVSLAVTLALALVYIPAWQRLFVCLFQREPSVAGRGAFWSAQLGTTGCLIIVLAQHQEFGPVIPAYSLVFVFVLAILYLELAWRGGGIPDAPLMHLAVALYLGGSFVFFVIEVLSGAAPGLAPTGFQKFSLDVRAVGMLGFAFVMAILMNRRSARQQVEQQRLKQELEAGAEMQALLLSTASVQAPGWSTETLYLPASEVGGDFHYAFRDGDALLVLVGDVSGKGLRAAMLVTMITGILRETAARQPGALLGALNRGLSGQTRGGFVTCCAIRFAADGTIRLANAGHPSPYLDGREFGGEPGLPLGLDPSASYSEMEGAARSVTLVSDGVIEAANPQGDLFGFERTLDLSTQSAQEIAEAAKQWGQNDDITVVTVRRIHP